MLKPGTLESVLNLKQDIGINMITKFGQAYIGNHGYYVVTSKKEGNHNKLLHRLIFEDFYGDIPKHYHVHHKNGNKLDNCILNLQLISEKEHHSLHTLGYKHTDEDRIKMSKIKTGKSNTTNSTGYYRVYKEKGKQYAQGFTYTYEVDSSRLDNTRRKKKKIRRTKLDALEKAVKNAGYEWRKL